MIKYRRFISAIIIFTVAVMPLLEPIYSEALSLSSELSMDSSTAFSIDGLTISSTEPAPTEKTEELTEPPISLPASTAEPSAIPVVTLEPEGEPTEFPIATEEPAPSPSEEPTVTPSTSPPAEVTQSPTAPPIPDAYEPVRERARGILAQVTDDTMTEEQKLKVIWDYLTDTDNITYKKMTSSTTGTDWAYSLAEQLMIEKKGNEYAQNAAFALLASEIGYDAKFYVGKTWSKKNRGKGKKKLQAFVIISNYYYDVASQLSGFAKNIYKKKQYGISFFAEAGYDFFNRGQIKGIKKIAGSIYGFNKKGKVIKSKKKISVVEVQSEYLAVNQYGRAKKGWYLSGNSLFCFRGSMCAAVKNATVNGIPFSSTGKAKSCLNTSIKIRAMKLLKKITRQSDKKSVKLRKIFEYLSSKRYFHYEIKYPDLKSKSWPKEYANYMLKSHGGNCYGFACTFSALANEIGYDPYIVYGRIHGRRDHAADGYTRHAMVKINGKYYDPEANWAGFLSNVYGRSSYPMRVKSEKLFRYKKAVGITSEQSSSKRNQLMRKGNKFYYYGSNGKLVTGTYLIKQKLYCFNKKHYMTLESYKEYQKVIKERTPFYKLKKLIGDPISSKNNGASCYLLNGEDWVYRYQHFEVYTFKSLDGEEIVLSLTALE